MTESFVNCPACLEAEPNQTRITKRPPLLFDVAQVRALGRVEQTNVRHAFDLPRILAQYSLRQRVNCSFPGHHSHMNGFIGLPRCSDMTLCVGHTCALHSVLDWAELSEQLDEFDLERSRMAMIRAVPDLSARFAQLTPRINRTPPQFIINSDVLAQTREASVFLSQCRSSWNPDAMNEAELEMAARIVQRFAEAIIAAEHSLAAVESALQGEIQRQWERQTTKVVRKEVRQLFKEMQRRR